MDFLNLSQDNEVSGSDLYIDDMIFKLCKRCPIGKMGDCKVKILSELRDFPIERRYEKILKMSISEKLQILSQHYSCYNSYLKKILNTY